MLDHNFNVMAFNFEGHGGRAATREYSIALFTQNTQQLLEEQQLDKVDIFGYSMGGYVALNLALKHPDKVNSIVTLGTKFNWTAEAAARETRMLNPDKMEEKIPKFTAQLRELHHPLNWREVVEHTAGMMTAMGNGSRLEPEDLQRIPHKVLIGIGSQDNMVSLEESQDASRHLPNASLKVIDDFKHPIEMVDKTTLAGIITRFILENA